MIQFNLLLHIDGKVVQKAVEMILSVIYEPNFYDFSHGFRAGHSQHMEIKELREECIRTNTNWISKAALKKQLMCLPEDERGRKIPFASIKPGLISSGSQLFFC